MKEVFIISRKYFTDLWNTEYLWDYNGADIWSDTPNEKGHFATYPSAQSKVKELPKGYYQIEKFFVI